MQVSIESTGTIERRMTIGVPADKVEQEVEKRLKDAARNVRMNGFRPGKAPMSAVRSRFGTSVRQEVVGEVMRDAYSEALTQQEIAPASYPRFEAKTIAEGKDLEFIAIFEVLPEIHLPDLSALEVVRETSEIGESDIDKMIDNLRSQHGTLKSVDRQAKLQDQVTIDFEGFVDGEAFEGGKAEGYRLKLGSNQMIPGFEDGLVGAKAGGEIELNVTFPADYQNAELAGKAAQFKVTVKSVEETELPELTADFFDKFGLKDADLAAFRSEVEGNMRRELKHALANKVKNQVVEVLLAKVDFPVPQSLIAQEVDRQRQDAVQRFGGRMKADQLPVELFTEQATKRVRTGLLFQELIRQHKIEVDPAKVDEKIKEIASTYEQPQEVIDWYGKNPQQAQQLESLVLEEAVVDLVLDQASVTDRAVGYEDAIKPSQNGV